MASLPADQAKAQALARFEDPGPDHINCGQAVLCFALLRMGEDPELITEARYFGGGIAGMGEICGVLNGTALALGVRDLALIRRGVKEPPSAADPLKAILRDFADGVRLLPLPRPHRVRPELPGGHGGVQEE